MFDAKIIWAFELSAQEKAVERGGLSDVWIGRTVFTRVKKKQTEK